MLFGCVSLWENLDYVLAALPFPASMHTRIALKKQNLNKVCSIRLFCKLSYQDWEIQTRWVPVHQ